MSRIENSISPQIIFERENEKSKITFIRSFDYLCDNV